jgi:hypothetical protein
MTDLLFVWMPFIAAALIIVFGISMLFLGSKTYVKAVLLRRHGVVGVATITHRYRKQVYQNSKERHGEATRYTEYFDYEIRHESNTYAVKGRTPSSELWERKSVGSEIDVIYLPQNPKNNQLAETYAHAGTVGGVIQMIAGTVLTTGAAVYLLAGLWEATKPPQNWVAQDGWVRDQAIVQSIGQTDDPFMRIMQPNTRQVRLMVGDDDGGRELIGQVDVFLGPNEYPELRVDDVLFVLRDPDFKDQAVLQKIE